MANERHRLCDIVELRQLPYGIGAGSQKRADSYFSPEERVRLVRLVSHWEPGSPDNSTDNSESDDIYPDSIRQDLGKSQEINV